MSPRVAFVLRKKYGCVGGERGAKKFATLHGVSGKSLNNRIKKAGEKNIITLIIGQNNIRV